MLIRLATELQFPNQFKISFHRDWVVSQKGKNEKKSNPFQMQAARNRLRINMGETPIGVLTTAKPR